MKLLNITQSLNAINEAARVSLDILRVMIPITLAIEAFKYFGFIDDLGRMLDPVMASLGLPGTFGIVLATSMITHLYAGIGVFTVLAQSVDLTVAQVTVLGAVMLIAHSLPLEVRVAQRAGARLGIVLGTRLLGAYIYGVTLHVIFSATGWLDEKAVIAWSTDHTATPTLHRWLLEQVEMMAIIFAAVFILMLGMSVLERSGIKGRIAALLAPCMRIVGIGEVASSTAVVGGLLGMVYGGALIIREARTGAAPARDTFLCLMFMGIFHSAIEDTLLMMAMGGSIWGLLFGRLIFALAITYLSYFMIRQFNELNFRRYFYELDRTKLSVIF